MLSLLIGLYGQLWVGAMKFWADLAHDLMRLKPSKLPSVDRKLLRCLRRATPTLKNSSVQYSFWRL